MTRPELARLFRSERTAFARRYPKVRRTALYIMGKPGGLPHRANAFALTARRKPSTIVFYAEALRLPRRNILGLLRHELGHVADPTPRRARGEQRADDIAEAVTGTPIRYEGRHAVQSIGRGAYPRPCWIHQ